VHYLSKLKRFISSNIVISILIFSAIVIIGSYSEYITQRNVPDSEIKNPALALWFAFQTVTTVGYGDVLPVNSIGMTIAVIIMVSGVIAVSILTASIAAYMTNINFTHKVRRLKMKNQTIICNYNDYSANIINNYLERNLKIESLVLIADLKDNPVKSDYISFVSGEPTDEKTLINANICYAKRVIITGDFNSNVPLTLIDAKTILNIFQIRKLNKNAEIIAQIAKTENVENAKSAGADQVITLNELSSMVIAKSILNPGLPDFILKLLSSNEGPKIFSYKISENFNGYILSDFTKNFNKISIISILSDNKYIFPIDNNYKFKTGDIIYFISDHYNIKELLK